MILSMTIFTALAIFASVVSPSAPKHAPKAKVQTSPSWEVIVSHETFTVSIVDLICNCGGSTGIPVTLSEGGHVTGWTMTGTCSNGFCSGQVITDDPGSTLSASTTIPPGYCFDGFNVTAKNTATGYTFPRACGGDGDCPAGTYTMDSFTYTPILSPCIVGDGGN
jgi:hypothetical protein